MIKFLDLKKINNRFTEDLTASFRASVAASHYVLGPNLLHFEKQFADYCGSKHCIGVANGMDALTLILKGYIQLGKLNKGDKVIVPANTFIATILSVLHAELVPVLVMPNPKTYNLCPEKTLAAITSEVKAIIVVHLYGQLVDVTAFRNLAQHHHLLLIEDAAQAHGASTKACGSSKSSETLKLRRAGNIGHAAAFSFYPSKNLGALGDGGAITTSDTALETTIKMMRNYGSSQKYKHDIIGYNSRLDDMQAAFLSIKLKMLDKDNARRRVIAMSYLKGICNPKIQLPFYNTSEDHVFYAFVIQVEDRVDFTNYLTEQHIEWLIHYPIPPERQNALCQFFNVHLLENEQVHSRVLSLPISPVMTDEEVETVIKTVNAY